MHLDGLCMQSIVSARRNRVEVAITIWHSPFPVGRYGVVHMSEQYGQGGGDKRTRRPFEQLNILEVTISYLRGGEFSLSESTLWANSPYRLNTGGR